MDPGRLCGGGPPGSGVTAAGPPGAGAAAQRRRCPAIGYEFTYSQDGRLVHSRQLNCFKGDMAYVITFTAYQQDFTADRAALDQILTSWVWT
jgi:hypothetical protein